MSDKITSQSNDIGTLLTAVLILIALFIIMAFVRNVLEKPRKRKTHKNKSYCDHCASKRYCASVDCVQRELYDQDKDQNDCRGM